MSTLTQPPPVHFNAVRRFTIEEYYRLVEAGILEEDARVELLDGQIIPMSPIGPRHEWLVRQLRRALEPQQHGRFETDKGRPLPVPDHDEPEPDLLLYRPGAADPQHHVRPADVFLVVEVSQTSLDHDLGFKANLYQRAKIPEYWVVALEHNHLHVFTLAGDRYKTRIVREGKVSPQTFPDVEIDVAALFAGA
ncbi:MAG: Uma2 family endonuclease [Verrucomicrobia bacterium]|nr:Uma2 family endonuclease [Verrucomicrobiota bacterium]